MDRTELAWAAGFWDGEGSAYLSGALDRATRHPQARINQSSTAGIPEVLTRFRQVLGFGRVQGPYLEEGKEPLFRWVVSSQDEVRQTFGALAPWLGEVKLAQFAELLDLGPQEPRRAIANSDELVAWCAGFFDGEGSTYLAKHQSHRGSFLLEAAITQSSWRGIPEVLERFHAAFGIGKIYGPYPGGDRHAPVYRWKSHQRAHIEAMLTAMDRHLGSVKRQQAASAVRVVALQLPLPRGNPAWGNRKSHCVHGHEYATARIRPFRARGKNTEAPRSSHQCLACVREYSRRKRREREMQNGG